MNEIAFFWFRRDLRLNDNAGLFHALAENPLVQPIFIFDTDILHRLENPRDARVHFLHQRLGELKAELNDLGSDLWIRYGTPAKIWRELGRTHKIRAVYANEEYEPSARSRDEEIAKILRAAGSELKTLKDHCLFGRHEVLTGGGTPYTVYGPYKRKVLEMMQENPLPNFATKKHFANLRPARAPEKALPLKALGFQESSLVFPSPKARPSIIRDYQETRNIPGDARSTTRVGLHLRFGTISVRDLARQSLKLSDPFFSQLVWRDFFTQILYHHPRVVTESYRAKFERVDWRTSKAEFERWASGTTGYPLVDAGMRELNATGFMHNRVRMVVASFLTKHLLHHWLEGERYFAGKLLDYDLASNNGNWQWVAGSGCDAAPYFRIFHPGTQLKRFDSDFTYVKKWIPEYGTPKYPKPMIDHDVARGRALAAYTSAFKGVSL